ncbi:MAG: DUF4337 domain-containing protein [Acidobacteriaceae bacterium]|nr:DUF4337 domain-containing protein [Acidobacteriaceae bacterium]
MAGPEEVDEQVHHAHESGDPFDKIVAGVMATIAALLAIVSVLGQHFNTEKVLAQQQASDQWAYYQAKDIRRYTAALAQDMLSQIKGDQKIAGKYAQDSARYRQQTEQILERAHELEAERDKIGRQADFYHFGEVFLEIAIVLSSLSILFRRRALFVGGVSCAVTGCVISLYGWIVFGLASKT